MPAADSPRERAARVARVWADALTYAGVVTALTAGCAMTLGIATGGGFVRGNVLLFVAGWGLLAYATVRLWPSSPDDLGTDPADPIGEARGASTRIQTLARSVPPARWVRPPAREDRMTPEGKLLVSSVLVLALSFVLETVFGIG